MKHLNTDWTTEQAFSLHLSLATSSLFCLLHLYLPSYTQLLPSDSSLTFTDHSPHP